VKHISRLALVWLLGCGPADEVSTPAESFDAADAPDAARRALWPPLNPDDVIELAADPLAQNYYVIFDGSGSMRSYDCADGQPRIEAAKAALGEFARAVPERANLGLLAFDTAGVSERLSLGARNRDAFIQAARRIEAAHDTPLASAIRLGYGALTRQARSQRGYGSYNLVVVTDGEASDGEDPSDVVAQILAESTVVIHTIGFCLGDDHSLNQAGRVLYRSATDTAELRAGLGEVLAEAPSFDVANF
jgi:Ca-activated chloride channel homolog